MVDLVAALGLALALEGLLFAAFPDGVRRAMDETAAARRSERLRLVGIVCGRPRRCDRVGRPGGCGS